MNTPLHRIILLALIAVLLGLYGLHLPSRERIDPGEGGILAMVDRMGREPVSMAWLNAPPVTPSCYGPLYYLVALGASKLTVGTHSLLGARLVSMLAGIAVLVLVFLAVMKRSGRVDAGLMAAVLFLSSTPVLWWLPLARVDMLALAFMVLAYVVASRSVLMAAVAIAAGSLTRQTVVLDVIPIAISLWALHGRGRAVKFLVLSGLFVAAGWGAAIWWSGGYFWIAGIKANTNPIHLDKAILQVNYLLRSPIAPAAILVAVIVGLRHSKVFLAGNVVLVGFVLHLIADPVMSGKTGSNVNYLLPVITLGVMLIGAEGIPLLMRLNERRAPIALVVLAVVAAFPNLFILFGMTKVPMGEPKVYAPIEKLIQSHPTNYIGADGPWMELALKGGGRPVVSDGFLLNLVWELGVVDQKALVSSFDDGRVGWLLLDRTIEEHLAQPEPFWPRPVVEAFQRNYKLVHVEYRGMPEQNLYVYAHRSFAPAPGI